MPYQEIDEGIRNGLLHTRKRDEIYASEAKQRIWATIEIKKRTLSWGMLSAMAACVLLLLVCGVLFLKLDQQAEKLDEMTALIHVLKQNKPSYSPDSLGAQRPKPDTKVKPLVLKAKPLAFRPEESDRHSSRREFHQSIGGSKPISRPALSLPGIEIAIPEITTAGLAQTKAIPEKSTPQKLPYASLQEPGSKNNQKFRIRWGSIGHFPDKNQSLALQIKL